jgi:ribosomal protein S18 acetylase RimI-like enzyme
MYGRITLTTIRLIEELSMNALPCLQTLHYDGWILRFAAGANGYPRRANSISPLYPSILPLEEKIAFCETQYTNRGFKTVFKMTLASPPGLEAVLKERGYIGDTVSSVQTLDLANVNTEVMGGDIVREPRVSAAWFADYCRLSEVSEPRAATMLAMLEALPVKAAYLRLRREGETVALGLGTLERGWFGLYDIVTDVRFRQQGIGTQLLQHLMRWGKAGGAHSAYLQVMTENTAGQRLYAKMGFREVYQYWYLQNRID